MDLSRFFGFAGGGTIFGGACDFDSGSGPLLTGRIVRRESSLHDLQVAMSADRYGCGGCNKEATIDKRRS